MLFFEFILLATVVVLFAYVPETDGFSAIPAVALLMVFVVCVCGFFVVNPNRSRVLVLFGRTAARCGKPGFYWTNPFTRKKRSRSGRTT